MNKLLLLLLLVAFGVSCSRNSTTEVYQTSRNEIRQVKDDVHKICMEDVLIGSVARVFLLNNHFIVADCKSDDKLIRIFDKNDFGYVCSVGTLGEGPEEITNMGFIGCNSDRNEFYVSDHAKQKIFCYAMDSILQDSMWVPSIKASMNAREFPSRYRYFSDTLSIALIIKPTGNSGYDQCVARWNMEDGTMLPMQYKHPQIKKKRVSMDASEKNRIYVEGYSNCDLITICDFNGNLIRNIYGPDWRDHQDSKYSYYRKIAFYKDKIIALYSGKDAFCKDEGRGVSVVLPTGFLLFDLQGNYLKTLDVGYKISDFCCDEENGRLIMNFDDEIQFGYLDLDSVAGF